MEESQHTLHRPLAFYPFGISGAIETGMNFWTLESENRDLSYNVPLYSAATVLSFPLLKRCHVFDQPQPEVPDRTNFIPELLIQDYNSEQINLHWNTGHFISALQHESDKSLESNPLAVNSSEDSCDLMTPGTSSGEKSVKIWRPFSPEPDCESSSNKTVNSGTLRKQKGTACEAPSCKLFPTILPSSVTLEESSVFKAVKKKKYQCRYCDQWYSNSGELVSHIRAHIGSKPYRCEHQGCMRAFARNEELTRHRRIHSGVKPHLCETCQKRFGRKDHLNKHKKTHMKASEKKIYLCEVPGCKHRYTRSDALTRHLATAHSIRHQKSNTGKTKRNLFQIPSTVQ